MPRPEGRRQAVTPRDLDYDWSTFCGTVTVGAGTPEVQYWRQRADNAERTADNLRAMLALERRASRDRLMAALGFLGLLIASLWLLAPPL